MDEKEAGYWRSKWKEVVVENGMLMDIIRKQNVMIEALRYKAPKRKRKGKKGK